MSRNLSVFLDLLRLFAAMLVLIGHAGEVYQLQLPAMIGHSAKEGVAIFFVLSGFVIAFVAQNKEKDWRAFARARALRMYSVVPLAVAVLVLCYALGVAFDPQAYAAGSVSLRAGAIGEPPGGWLLLRYLTFTNEIWFDRAMISTGAPFWSLGYEVAYYVGFAVMFYGRGVRRWVLAGLWLAVCGPRIILAFPLWLLGVAAWSVVRRGMRMKRAHALAALSLVALTAIILRKWCAAVAMPLFEWAEAGRLAASMGYYLSLGLLLAAAIVILASAAVDRSIWPRRLEGVVRFCAGASFTLYIAHLPVMVLISVMWPGSNGSLLGGLTATALTFVITLSLAELGERRKAGYAKFFSKISMWVPVKNKESIPAID
ncbi:acyltransferase family protein [Novosphingobium guangzhouense]|uniref:Acyltransferase 3 domain-containing protein n=1 Tax=Novosphingobium guangzhouense TaxID=1850347 RepID=A0A2K2G3I5_9SPHN|nr:acyltransferase family protein [Novosphingobium guangzhouense]PNU05603.1 hypothetical protein A8V01_15705 [Novosphingobium guangzhouense]